MTDVIFYIALLWLVVLFSILVVLTARASSGLVRVLTLDVLTLVTVALMVIYSVTTGTSYYLDAAVVLSLISFISVIAAARYHSERRLF
jgi:multicomponent Na+:H+ antiporter subunit F